jgi:hypothetical protein
MAQTKHDSGNVVKEINVVSELTVKTFKFHPCGKFVTRMSLDTGGREQTSKIILS